MAGQHRLPAPAGRLIERGRVVDFKFDGRRYQGLGGDTIASALAANGVRLLSRSFKYHRPRGVLTMAGHDANTLVQIAGEPNVRADRRPIVPGMEVTAQNYLGSLANDWGMILDRFSRFMPVGFYYKAFYKPRGSFRFWEKVIRASTGLGRVDTKGAHGYYDKAYAFCDVAVVGAGPAGMAAALEAARAGAEVILIDENRELGGALGYARFDGAGARGDALLGEMTAEIAAEPNITVLSGATCQALFEENWLPVTKGNRLYKLRAKAVVAATGSLDQHLVFRNNDLPGVMMGSAAQRLIRLYGVRPGRRAVVVGAGEDIYGVALDLAEAGIEVAAVVDLCDQPVQGECSAAVGQRGIEVMAGHTVAEAEAGPKKRSVTGVRVSAITGQGSYAADGKRLDCDLVCMCGGYAPNAALLYHAGGKLAYDDATAMFQVRTLPEHLFAAGSVNGAFDLDAVVAEGRHAGWSAAADAGAGAGAEPPPPNERGAEGRNHPWPMFPHPKGKDFIDFDEDLQTHDILNAIADGYDDVQLLKRYSTVGMGPSQGRHSAVPSIRLAARATGRDIDDFGTTTSRPPVGPIKLGHLAGRTFEPVRLTPMHHRHLEAGATMMHAGQWFRPAFYGPEDQREACIRAEAENVRNNVGLVDVSTLGGLDVRGPDAAEFLNRMYTFAYLKQPVGKARYLLMTDQSGVIVDDGVACRFHDNHFYVTATTGGVEGVYRQMLWYNAQWRLEVDVTNATAAFSGVNIAGPRSRQVLEKICGDVDLSPEAFPYMGVREGTVAGIPARLLRVGFVGELGFELHVPASSGEALWDALMEAGRSHQIRPFGVEPQRVLRLEKGHIIIGQDTDGLTNPHQAEMGWAIAKKKPYFVGKRSIEIQNADGPVSKLVGFETDDPEGPVPEECRLVMRGSEITGRVTSAVRSPALGKVIGLAYVAPDQAAEGGRFDIKLDGARRIAATVIPVPFYDPDNKRQEL